MKHTAPLLVPGGHLTGDLAGTWAGAALAEITHGPTGYADLNMTLVRLAPGETAPARGATAAGHQGPLLLAVLRGRIRVSTSGSGPDVLVAATGDAVAIPPGLATPVEVGAEGGEPAEYLIYVLPAPAPRDGPPP